MKNFFIPHSGNDFLPHALHPRRLTFYIIGSVLIKLVMAGFLLIFPITAWLTPDILTEQSQRIIELTNVIRRDSGLPALEENSLLKQAAYHKAEDMLLFQYFSHVGKDNRKLSDWLKLVKYDFSVAGENLAMGFSSAEDVVNAWVASKTHYANLIDRDFTEIGVGMASGLYDRYETTLVAQYFGAPAGAEAEPVVRPPEPEKKLRIETPPANTLGENIKPEPKESRDNADGNQPAAEAPKQTVKPEPLIQPVILAPGPGLVATKEVGFEIFSPGSESIQLLAGDKELFAASKKSEEEYFKFNQTLDEGPHQLKLVARRGEESSASDSLNLMVDLSAPLIDGERTRLIVDSPVGQKEKIVMATAYLSPDTQEARVSLKNYQIELKKDQTDSNRWTGRMILFDDGEEEIQNPVVLASITATDYAGNSVTGDIAWANITPAKTSLLNQYFFLKGHQSAAVKKIFDISSLYYFTLLIIASIALLLNIFVNIRQQHPQVILKAIGLICLLTFLIIL